MSTNSIVIKFDNMMYDISYIVSAFDKIKIPTVTKYLHGNYLKIGIKSI